MKYIIKNLETDEFINYFNYRVGREGLTFHKDIKEALIFTYDDVLLLKEYRDKISKFHYYLHPIELL